MGALGKPNISEFSFSFPLKNSSASDHSATAPPLWLVTLKPSFDGSKIQESVNRSNGKLPEAKITLEQKSQREWNEL